jgi:hypothetical protein
MKNFKIISVLLGLSIFILTGSSLVNAQSISTKALIVEHLEVYVPCANNGLGENIVGDLPLHVVFQFKDGVLVRMHGNPLGHEMIGETTGDRYLAVGATQFLFDVNPTKGAFTESFVDRTRLVGKGIQYNLKRTTHLTVNPNFEVTVDFDFSYEYCK